MPGLTQKQLNEFLTSGRRLLKLATLTEDGSPYVVPLWYDYDGEAFSVAGRRRARWVANIRRDGRVGGLVDTEEAAYVRVVFQGRAEILDDAWLHSSPTRAIRYLGEEAGLRYYESTHHEPRALVRIVPESVQSWAGPGWHPRYRG